LVYHCLNRDCPNVAKLSQGERCLICGAEAKDFGFQDAVKLVTAKRQHAQISDKLESGSAQLLVTEKMTDEEIRKRIYEDMMHLAAHEAGSGWMRLGTLLSGSSTDQMLGAGFKALIDQNKIMIRQNELILRSLKQPPPPPP
jgi:hypothetical protein